MLKRWIDKKALQVDINRWRLAERYMSPTEEGLFNAPARIVFDDAVHVSYVFLTDVALLMVKESNGACERVPLDRIKVVEKEPGYKLGFRLGWRDEEGAANAVVVDLYDSPLSVELWRELVARLSA